MRAQPFRGTGDSVCHFCTLVPFQPIPEHEKDRVSFFDDWAVAPHPPGVVGKKTGDHVVVDVSFLCGRKENDRRVRDATKEIGGSQGAARGQGVCPLFSYSFPILNPEGAGGQPSATFFSTERTKNFLIKCSLIACLRLFMSDNFIN